MRAIFLADGKVFTTGFSRMSERQLALWDPVSGVASLRQAGLRPGPHPRILLAEEEYELLSAIDFSMLICLPGP